MCRILNKGLVLREKYTLFLSLEAVAKERSAETCQNPGSESRTWGWLVTRPFVFDTPTKSEG